VERRAKQTSSAKSPARCKEEKDKKAESQGDEMRQGYFLEFLKIERMSKMLEKD